MEKIKVNPFTWPEKVANFLSHFLKNLLTS